jgi:osmotically-inducible protein OsmY
MTTNEQLRSTIMDELVWHALIDASQIDVSVDDHVVTVVGSVPSVATKLVVIDTIEAITDVHDIVSEIDVAPTGSRSDDEIDMMVGSSLAWDALVPENQVSHRVVDGWVTLSGELATGRQKTEAERVVNHILGVRGVTNDLRVSEAEISPPEIRDGIRDALARRALRAAEHIDVVVDGHTVTLRGSVQSRQEKRAVIGTVGHAAGVEVLCDDLVVRSRA